MKRMLFLVLLTLCPLAVRAQSYVNPDTTQQQGDIILQNTDVYYKPMAPPGPMDTRENLCNQSDVYNDPNGVGSLYRDYLPRIYDPATGTFVPIYQWSPACDFPYALGGFAIWQRFFTAKRDASGHPHDIIAAGGPNDSVIVSKNEDVDFRASGRIKLKSRFHAKAGCRFHAYIEPKWGDSVFSDDFNNIATFDSNWHISQGWGDENSGAECSVDSNAYIDTDYQAYDGYALDLVLREAPGDSCSCNNTAYSVGDSDNCVGTALASSTRPSFAFTSAQPWSCPYPFSTKAGTLGAPSYADMPYGKYEFRDKVPHTLHHTNNWGASSKFEFDLGETFNATMGVINPNWGHSMCYGPYNGIFQIVGSDTLFVCSTAGRGRHVQPQDIIINNVQYGVTLDSGSRVAVVSTGIGAYRFPGSIVNTTDSTQFYYQAPPQRTADTVTWTVVKGSDDKWDMFSASWDTTGGVPHLFTRSYQPTSLTLTGFNYNLTVDSEKVHNCHWVDSANDPMNYGKIYLDDPIDTSDPKTYTEAYQYTIYDGGSTAGPPFRYPVQAIKIDRDTDMTDSSSYDSTPYRYHTFTMEWLPHEVRYLIDSNVVLRFPDRLVPRNNPFYDWVGTGPRQPMVLYPAEIDIDYARNDPMGTDSATDGHGNDSSITYLERHYFETHENETGEGFWPVNGQPAAHHLLDYVKIWDVPKEVQIPPFPH